FYGYFVQIESAPKWDGLSIALMVFLREYKTGRINDITEISNCIINLKRQFVKSVNPERCKTNRCQYIIEIGGIDLEGCRNLILRRHLGIRNKYFSGEFKVSLQINGSKSVAIKCNVIASVSIKSDCQAFTHINGTQGNKLQLNF